MLPDHPIYQVGTVLTDISKNQNTLNLMLFLSMKNVNTEIKLEQLAIMGNSFLKVRQNARGGVGLGRHKLNFTMNDFDMVLPYQAWFVAKTTVGNETTPFSMHCMKGIIH